MLSVSLLDRTNLAGVQKAIIKAAEQGVKAATKETISWIKDDVIRGQSYVGHQYYPDNSAATKRIKAKKGQTLVLKDTGNYLSSWNGEVRNMKGIIHGGGKDYHADLYERGWKIDKLWESEHKKESEKIITKAIEKAV